MKNEDGLKNKDDLKNEDNPNNKSKPFFHKNPGTQGLQLLPKNCSSSPASKEPYQLRVVWGF